MPSFRCADIGMSCGFKATAANERELLRQIAVHAGKAHNMEPIPPDVMAKVMAAIKK